jgi:hypothetical protein
MKEKHFFREFFLLIFHTNLEVSVTWGLDPAVCSEHVDYKAGILIILVHLHCVKSYKFM